MGKVDQAIADFDRAIALGGTAADYSQRGSVYIDKGQLDRAILDFDRALELDPKQLVAYVNRAVAYRLKGQHERALADFDQAILLNPKIAPHWRNQAISRVLARDIVGAQNDIAEALRLGPNDARTLYVSGIVEEAAGNAALAAKRFEDARLSEPSATRWAGIEKDLARYRPKR